MSTFRGGGGGGRPVCKFFLEGKCRFGDGCKNEHPRGQAPQSRNSFAPLGGGGGRDRAGGVGDRYRPGENRDQRQSLPYGLDHDLIKADVTPCGQPNGEKPIWPLSAYAPGRDAPRQLIEGKYEQSPEEVRVQYYLAKASGDPAKLQEYEQNERMAAAEADQVAKRIFDGVQAAIDYVIAGENQHPNRNDQIVKNTTPWPPTAFANGNPPEFGSSISAFGGQQQRPAFGAPSAPGGGANPFNRPAAQPAFGGGQAPAFGSPSNLGGAQPQQPAFGGPSVLGGSQQRPAFGAPSALGGQTQTPAFGAPSALGGQTQTPAFGAPSNLGGQQPTPAFGQPSSVSGQQQTSAFGQPSNLAGQRLTPAFGAPSNPGGLSPFSGAGQGQQQTTGSPFGASGNSVGPQANGVFGQGGNTGLPAGASPFASANVGTSSGFGASLKPDNPFGASSGQQKTNPFSQTSNAGSGAQTQNISAFGTLSQPAPNGFNNVQQSLQQQQQQPKGTPGTGLAATSSYISRHPNGTLQTFKGRPVTYLHPPNPDSGPPPAAVPTYPNATHGNKPERIWMPNGPPEHPNLDAEAPPEAYDGETGALLKQAYDFLRETGEFKDSVMPEVPPKQEWVGWDL